MRRWHASYEAASLTARILPTPVCCLQPSAHTCYPGAIGEMLIAAVVPPGNRMIVCNNRGGEDTENRPGPD